MKQIFILFYFIILCMTNLYAQMTVEEVNHRLDTRPYFELGLQYDSDIILPDSVKIKMIKALNRELPQRFADSVFTLSETVLENITISAWQKCKTDTVCFEREYQRMYEEDIAFEKKNYSNRCYSRSLILACGSWNITESIPYLEKELQDKKCAYLQEEVKASLAKLGNDSIYRQIKESRTLSYLISHTEFDTINNNAVINENIGNSYAYGINDFLASYFNDKHFLYDMLDLLYLKGQVPFIGLDYTSIEISLLMDFSFLFFQSNPNVNSWRDICDAYLDIYIDAKKNKKLYKQVSSHAYKQKMIAELKKWIDENIVY